MRVFVSAWKCVVVASHCRNPRLRCRRRRRRCRQETTQEIVDGEVKLFMGEWETYSNTLFSCFRPKRRGGGCPRRSLAENTRRDERKLQCGPSSNHSAQSIPSCLVMRTDIGPERQDNDYVSIVLCHQCEKHEHKHALARNWGLWYASWRRRI